MPHLPKSGSGKTAIDPVCGMTVDPASAKYTSAVGGADTYFCSARCLARFEADPAAYQDGPAKPVQHPPVHAANIQHWTCPMHPEIIRDAPGPCPLCGMALEPKGVPADPDAPNAELIDMTWRFWIALILALPVFVLEMGGHFPGLHMHELVPQTVSLWIQFSLATPVVLWAGFPFFQRGWQSLLNRSLNTFSLVSLGIGTAYLYSLAATFLPDLFPSALHADGGMVPIYYEAAAVITVLVLLGQVLELRARDDGQRD